MAYSKSKRDLYQEVTDKIIDSLEQGVSPWVCPWDRSGEMTLPVNHSSGDFYRGINVCLLWMEQQLRGFSSSRWMTYPCVRIVVASKINFRGKKNESKIYRRI